MGLKRYQKESKRNRRRSHELMKKRVKARKELRRMPKLEIRR